MSKRTKDEFRQRKEIQAAGWEINQTDKVAFNSGSETARHMVCKTLVAHYLKHERGYRVDSEVEHPERGEVDIVGYGSSGQPIAVECETAPTQAVIEDKLDRYVGGTVFRECFVLDVNEMPENIMDAYTWVADNL